mgnify:CR=1 FL=1
MYFIVLITALLPVAILLIAIYHKDKAAPEPAGQLVKAFVFGVISAGLAIVLSTLLEVAGLYSQWDPYNVNGVRMAFFGAAVPEETAKLFMLWLLLRRNRFFDENMDGIVYAAFVSLGFAAIENVSYLFSEPESFLSVGIMRACTSIPGHFCFGIIMGYYYSLATFGNKATLRNKIFVWLIPVMAHGFYDAILFITNVPPVVSVILSVIFFVLLCWMGMTAKRKVREVLERDGINN